MSGSQVFPSFQASASSWSAKAVKGRPAAAAARVSSSCRKTSEVASGTSGV